MPTELSQIRKHLFLTGDKQVGKSTLLKKLIEAKSLDCTGFETRAFYLNGERRGFTLHGFVDMPPYENDCICCARIAEKKSVPVSLVFQENGVRILKESLSSTSAYILMDELGRLERESEGFIEQVFACLDSPKRVIGVLQKCSSEHVKAISQRNDVTLITVTHENRNTLFDELCSAFE